MHSKYFESTSRFSNFPGPLAQFRLHFIQLEDLQRNLHRILPPAVSPRHFCKSQQIDLWRSKNSSTYFPTFHCSRLERKNGWTSSDRNHFPQRLDQKRNSCHSYEPRLSIHLHRLQSSCSIFCNSKDLEKLLLKSSKNFHQSYQCTWDWGILCILLRQFCLSHNKEVRLHTRTRKSYWITCWWVKITNFTSIPFSLPVQNWNAEIKLLRIESICQSIEVMREIKSWGPWTR